MLPHWICQTWGVALGLLLLGGSCILQKEFSAAIFDISRGAEAVYHARYRGLQVHRRRKVWWGAPSVGPAGFCPTQHAGTSAADAQFVQARAGWPAPGRFPGSEGHAMPRQPGMGSVP